jgi:DNA-binding XRE family transcriptional regulator
MLSATVHMPSGKAKAGVSGRGGGILPGFGPGTRGDPRVQLARTREWREASGYTQRTLAAAAHVAEVTVVRIERGEDTSPKTARKIATAMGIEVRDLMEQAPVPLDEAQGGSAGGTPGPSGSRAVDWALSAARADREKEVRAINRYEASQGAGGATAATGFEEDRLRMGLRGEYGVSDGVFDGLVWPLAVEAVVAKALLEKSEHARAELERELEKARAEVKASKGAKASAESNDAKSLA